MGPLPLAPRRAPRAAPALPPCPLPGCATVRPRCTGRRPPNGSGPGTGQGRSDRRVGDAGGQGGACRTEEPAPASPGAAQARRERYKRLQTGEAFDYLRNNELAAYDPPAARSQLDELAPAVAVLAERAAGGAPVVLETGGGGTVVVLPGDPTTMPAEALGAALATLIELRQNLEAVRARRAGAGPALQRQHAGSGVAPAILAHDPSADGCSPLRTAGGASSGAVVSRRVRGGAQAVSERTTAAPSVEQPEAPPSGASLASAQSRNLDLRSSSSSDSRSESGRLLVVGRPLPSMGS